jgi:putative transposase
MGVAVFCLLPRRPNHVHLILVRDRKAALRRALGESRRRYSSTINARLGVTGHLFQARFRSVTMGA